MERASARVAGMVEPKHSGLSVAQHAQGFLQRVARLVEGDHVRLRIAGAGDQLRVIGGGLRLQGGHRHGGRGEGDGIGSHLVVDGVGHRAQFGSGVAAEVDASFGVVHGFAGGRGNAVPCQTRVPSETGGIPGEWSRHGG